MIATGVKGWLGPPARKALLQQGFERCVRIRHGCEAGRGGEWLRAAQHGLPSTKSLAGPGRASNWRREAWANEVGTGKEPRA